MCVHNVNRMLIVHAYAIGVLLVLQGQQRDVFSVVVAAYFVVLHCVQ